MHLDIIKASYDKLMANVLNGEMFKAFLLRSGTRDRMPTPSQLEPEP